MKTNKMKKVIKIILSMFIMFLLNINISYAEQFGWPLDRAETNVTSPMYDRTGNPSASPGYHTGWDFGKGGGTNVYASASGKVVRVGEVGSSSCGNFLVIEHQLQQNFVYDGIDYGKKIYTRYLHLESPSIYNVGDIVSKGTVVGIMGGTGTTNTSYAVHLHFDMISEATGGSGVSKSLSSSKGKGVSIYTNGDTHWKNVFTIICSKSNEKVAAFSPEILMGMDIVVPQGTSNIGQEGLMIGKNVVAKEDIIKALEVSSDIIEYGKLSNLEKAVKMIEKNVKSYAKIISAILTFVGTILVGFAIILSKKAEERMALMSGLMAIGVGSLIVASATYIADLIMK